MTDSSTITPPAQQGMENYSPDSASSVFSPMNEKQPRSPEKPKTPVEQPEKKPETKADASIVQKPAEPEKKKGVLDKLGAVKRPEAEEPAKPVANGATKPNPNDENLKVIRDFYTSNKDRIKELEGYKPELEATKGELAKLKAVGLNEQERKEYQLYRQMNAVEAVRSSKEFQEKITAPQLKCKTDLEAVAKHAKLSKAQESALMDAVDIDDGYERAMAIRSVLDAQVQNSEVALSQAQFETLYNRAVKSADHLKEVLYPREDEALSRAEEVQLAARQRQQQEQQKTGQQQHQEFKKVHGEVFHTLSTETLKPLMDDPDLALEGTTLKQALEESAPAQTIAERAYEVHAGAALPFVIEYANKALKRAHEAEKALAARNGAGTSRSDGGTKAPVITDAPVDPKEVFQGRGKNYMQ